MKIRKDFVTNSSSSSFVTAVVEMIPAASVAVIFSAAAEYLDKFEDHPEDAPSVIVEIKAKDLTFTDLHDQGQLDISVYEVLSNTLSPCNALIEVTCSCPEVQCEPSAYGDYRSTIALKDIPSQKSARLKLSVHTPEKLITKGIPLQFDTRIEITSRDNKKVLLTDDQDELTLTAKLISLKMTKEEKASYLHDLTFGLARSAKDLEGCLYYDEIIYGEDHATVTFRASPFDKKNPQESIEVGILASLDTGEDTYQSRFTLTLVSSYELEVSKDYVEVLMSSNQEISLEAWIGDEGAGEWEFTVDFYHQQRQQEEIVDIQTEKDDQGRLKIMLIDCGYQLPEGQLEALSEISIKAIQKDIEVERIIKVVLCQEGLFPIPRTLEQGNLLLHTDKEREDPAKISTFELVMARWDDTQKKMNYTNEAMEDLIFDPPVTEDPLLEKALSQSELFIRFKEHVPSNRPSGRFEAYLDNQVMDKKGELHKATVSVYYPDESDKYTYDLTLVFKSLHPEDYEDNWDFEVAALRRIISNYLPEPIRTKKREEFEAKKNSMGAHDIYELRHEIWDIAYDLMMEEVKYWEDEAAWIDKQITALEWTAWVGDRAFGILVGTFTANPFAGYVISQAKDTVVDLLVKLQTNTLPYDEFVIQWGQEKLVLFADKGGEELIKLKADPNSVKWVTFYFAYKVGMHYLNDYDEQGHPKGIFEAIKAAGWDLAGTALEEAIGPFAEGVAIRGGYLKSNA